MQLTTLFTIYLVLFRLSLIAAGVTSIILGYKLLAKASGPSRRGGGELEAKIGSSSFTLKDAAPGTFFALFGVIVISVMLLKDGPSLRIDNRNQVSQLEKDEHQNEVSIVQPATKDGSTSAGIVEVRGADEDGIDKLILRGLQEEQTDSKKATENYKKALSRMALPMNQLALYYQSSSRTEEAISMAQVAVSISPETPAYLDTLATLLSASGRRQEATRLLTKATLLDPKYKEKLDKVK